MSSGNFITALIWHSNLFLFRWRRRKRTAARKAFIIVFTIGLHSLLFNWTNYILLYTLRQQRAPNCTRQQENWNISKQLFPRCLQLFDIAARVISSVRPGCVFHVTLTLVTRAIMSVGVKLWHHAALFQFNLSKYGWCKRELDIASRTDQSENMKLYSVQFIGIRHYVVRES